MAVTRVLVTGAGGYIGGVLVPRLLADGFAVRAVDRFFFGREVLADHPALEVAVEDTRCLTTAHLDGVDAVIDLAAMSNDPSGEHFQAATQAINHRARARLARLAKAAGIERYILPSSCSIYGVSDPGTIADEDSPTNPQTTYARCNLAAETDILALADDGFTAVALRQATVFGVGPRMRFDLAVNGMVEGAWSTGRLPLMRDGSQWRPLLHVADAADALTFMLTAPAEAINGRVFNVGSQAATWRIGPLGETVASMMPRPVDIEWYGDPDTRSYRVGFSRIEALGWAARRDVAFGVEEVLGALEAGTVAKTDRTLTLRWYERLEAGAPEARALRLHGGLVDIDDREDLTKEAGP